LTRGAIDTPLKLAKALGKIDIAAADENKVQDVENKIAHLSFPTNYRPICSSAPVIC